MHDKAKLALEVDIQAITDNHVPLWLVLRALAKLGVIKHDPFMAAVRDVINEELAQSGPEPEFEKQLERCYQLIDFNDDTNPPPKPPKKGTPA